MRKVVTGDPVGQIREARPVRVPDLAGAGVPDPGWIILAWRSCAGSCIG